MKPSDASSGSPPDPRKAATNSAESAWADFQRALSETKDRLQTDRKQIEQKLTASPKSGKKHPKQQQSASSQPSSAARDPELAGMVEHLIQHYNEAIAFIEQQANTLRQASAGQESVAKQQASLQQLREQLDEKVKLIEANSTKELQRAETISRLQADMDRLAEQHQTAAARSEDFLQQKDRQISQHIQALRTREEQLHQSAQRANSLQQELDRLRLDRDRLTQQLAAMKQRFSSSQKMDDGLTAAADVSELALSGLEGVEGDGAAEGAQPGGPRLVMPILLILMLAAGGLALGAWLTLRPMYDIVGLIHVSPPDATVLAACEKAAWNPDWVPAEKSWRTPADPERGVLALHLQLPYPGQGIEQVNTIGQSVVAQVTHELHLGPSTQPVTNEAERNRIEHQIQDLGRQISAMVQASTAPATSPADIDQSYRTLQAERKQIASSVAQLAQRITREPPSESSINVDPNQIKNAEGGVKQLQADLTALAQRKQRLEALLTELIGTASLRIGTFLNSSVQAEGAITEASKGNYEADVIQKLQSMREHLGSWRQSVEKLRDACNSQSGLLKVADSSVDPVGVQSAVEQAAKAFLEQAGSAEVQLRQKLQGIGEGGEEPVKRTVLQRNLAQQLQPLLEGGGSLKAGAQSLIMGGNAQLDAVTRTLASLQSRVIEQRGLLESELRTQALAQARARFKQETQEAVAARDRLLERDRDIEADMSDLAMKATTELNSQKDIQKSLEARLDLYRRQSVAIAEYLPLTARPTTAAPSVEISYIPAEVTLITDSLSDRLILTLSLGMGPLVVSMLLLLLVAAWRKPSRTPLPNASPEAPYQSDQNPFSGA